MQAIILILLIPLMVLNFLGGIASGIWLAVLGQWRAILYGLAGLVAPFFIGLAMAPGMIFALPAVALIERGRIIFALPLLILNQLYTYSLVCAWRLGSFYIFISKATYTTMIPLLIWSYGVALGPWIFLGSKDRQSMDGSGSAMTTFFAQISYISIAIMAYFSRQTFFTFSIIFCSIMAIGMLLQTIIVLCSLRRSFWMAERL